MSLLKPHSFKLIVNNKEYTIFYRDRETHNFICFNPEMGRTYSKEFTTKAGALEKCKQKFSENIIDLSL